MDSRVNQEPLEVLWEEVRRPLLHQATTTPALTALVGPLAVAAMTTPALTALVGPLAVAAMTTLAAADTTTPPPERSQDSCKDYTQL